MRRTRHITLPVRSWQYVGLLIVSLACLTLGLVSRDREGKHGSLAGPELQHLAPHKVDICPNINPYFSTCNSDTAIVENIKAENIPPTETNFPTISSAESSIRSSTLKKQTHDNRPHLPDNRSRSRSTRVRTLSTNQRNVRSNAAELSHSYARTRNQVREQRLQRQLENERKQFVRQNRQDEWRIEERRARIAMAVRKPVSQNREDSAGTRNAVRRVQLLNRLSYPERQRSVRNERPELLMRRTSQQVRVSRAEDREIRQIRTEERVSRNSNRDMRVENSRLRESNRNSRMEFERRNLIPRELSQRRSNRINASNRAFERLNNDLIRRVRMNSNVKTREMSNERMDNMKTSRFDKVNVPQSRREIRTSIKPEVAPKYLSYSMPNVLNYDILQHTLIIALCIFYGTSVYNQKHSLAKRFASQVSSLAMG